MKTNRIPLVTALLVLTTTLALADPLGTAFTYQGRLTDSGSPAAGLYDFQFVLCDAATNGAALGTNTVAAASVTNGLYNVTLDFGSAAFNGNARWLELFVRTNGSAAWTALTPRQAVTPTPYALHAAAASGVTGVLPDAQLSANIPRLNGTNTFSGTITGAAFVGDGSGLTGLPASGIPSLNGRGTNTTLYTGLAGNIITYTNFTYPGVVGQLFDFASGTNNGGTQIRFSQTPGDAKYGDVFINPVHNGSTPSGANSEWQITMPSHLAIGPGWENANGGHIQIGIGGAQYMATGSSNGAYWVYLQSAGPKYTTWGTETKLTFSAPLTARCDGYFSGIAALERTFFPGIISQYRTVTTDASSLGIYEFDIYADLGLGTAGVGWGDRYNMSTIKHQVRNFAGDHQSTKINGGIMNNKTNENITATTKVLDFADFYARDFAAGTNSITLSTTNTLAAVAGSDTYAKSVFFIRAGGIEVTVTYPVGWNTNGFGLPTNLPAGKLVRLELEWLYPGGETNIVVNSAFVYQDNTFVWDSDAVAFLGRLGGTTLATSNAINHFVQALKSDGTWTNCDAIYPFVGASAASHALNLKSTNYSIFWHGAMTHDANGVTGDGSTGYGDTQFLPAAANGQFQKDSAHLFAYNGTQVLPDWNPLLGCWMLDHSSWAVLRSVGGVVGGGLNEPVFAGIGIYIQDQRGPLLVSRTGSAAEILAVGNSLRSGTNTSGSMPNANLGILAAIHDGGSVNGYCAANLRGATIGGGLTTEQWAALRQDWDEFQAALGRKVP
jgi:hypothetical protein